jgi:hypothetical protein
MNDVRSKLPVQIDVGAKANLELKAEVPASSLGRLFDAFTDLIRPFSEGRGLKADNIRLQREEVAIEIAKLARQRITIEGGHPQPLSNKLLVPLLERASCEDINDEIMIDKWANLLASASLKLSVQPRYVGILGELAGTQAKCLDCVAFNRHSEFHYPYANLEDAPFNFAELNVAKYIHSELRGIARGKDPLKKVLARIVALFNRPGVLLALAMIFAGREVENWLFYDRVQEIGIHDEEDLCILESLDLFEM